MSKETKLPDEIAVCPDCERRAATIRQFYAPDGPYEELLEKNNELGIAHRQVVKDREDRILELMSQNDALAVDLDAARRRVAGWRDDQQHRDEFEKLRCAMVERELAHAMLILAAEAETAQALALVDALRETLGCDTAEYIEQLEATARAYFRLKKQIGAHHD